MRKKILLVILPFLLVFSGCAAWTQLKAGEYKDKKRKFSSQVPEAWMRQNLYPYFIVTRNGFVLDHVIVGRYPLKRELDHTKKKFSSSMSPQDLAEVELDDIQSSENVGNFQLISNEPANIDGREAFRIEYEYTAKGGLEIKGIRYGFLEGEKIFRIRYEASKQHYFNQLLPDFQDFIKHFTVL